MFDRIFIESKILQHHIIRGLAAVKISINTPLQTSGLLFINAHMPLQQEVFFMPQKKKMILSAV